MITCSSEGNYRREPTCRSGRLKGTREPSLPGYLTIYAPTVNAGRGSRFASTGSEQMGQRQHHHSAQRRDADVEELQETPQASQQGRDAPAETQPRHLPIQKVHISYGGRAPWTREDVGAASATALPRQQPQGAHGQCLPTPLRSRGAPSPFTAEKQQQSWQGTVPRQQKAGPQVSRNSSAHFELGIPKPRHQAQCLKTAEAACRQLQKAPY